MSTRKVFKRVPYSSLSGKDKRRGTRSSTGEQEVKSKFQRTLEKEDVLDVIFFLLIALFAITIVFQITFIESTLNDIRDLGFMAMAIAVLSIVGVAGTSLFVFSGILVFKNFRKDWHGSVGKKNLSLRDIINKDDTFEDDFLKVFLIALIAQVGFSFLYGGFTGSIFDLTFRYDLNATLLVINTAVGEELFFTLFLSAGLLSLCKERWHTVFVGVINVAGFIAVHYIVYGSIPEAILYVLFLRILYFYLYYKTRRVSLPILLHVLNNFLFVSTILFI